MADDERKEMSLQFVGVAGIGLQRIGNPKRIGHPVDRKTAEQRKIIVIIGNDLVLIAMNAHDGNPRLRHISLPIPISISKILMARY